MTYARFLFVFVAVPGALLWAVNRRTGIHGSALPLWCLLPVVYLATVPWDSWAVRHGLWGFDPALTWAPRLFALPLEELLFFGLQTVLVGLWVRRRLWAHRREWGLSP